MIEIVVLSVGYARTTADGLYRANGTVTLLRQYHPTSSSSPFVVLVDTGCPYDGPALVKKLASLGVEVGDVDVVVGTHGHVDHVGNLNLFANPTSKTQFYVGGDKLRTPDIYETMDFVEELDIAGFPRTTTPLTTAGADRSITLRNCLPLHASTDKTEDTNDRIFLVKTPGHTDSDLSVVVASDEISLTCFDCSPECAPPGCVTPMLPNRVCTLCANLVNDVDGVDFRRRGVSYGAPGIVIVIAGDLFEEENDDDDDGASWKSSSSYPEIQTKNRTEMRRVANVIVPGHGRPFVVRRRD